MTGQLRGERSALERVFEGFGKVVLEEVCHYGEMSELLGVRLFELKSKLRTRVKS
jgi:hypothetical protein